MKQHACLNPGWVRSFKSSSTVAINIPERIPPLTVDDALEEAAKALSEQMSEIRRLESELARVKAGDIEEQAHQISIQQWRHRALSAEHKLQGFRDHTKTLEDTRRHLNEARSIVSALNRTNSESAKEINQLKGQLKTMWRAWNKDIDRAGKAELKVSELEGNVTAMREERDAAIRELSGLKTRLAQYGLTEKLEPSRAIVVAKGMSGWSACVPGSDFCAPPYVAFAPTAVRALEKLLAQLGPDQQNCVNINDPKARADALEGSGDGVIR